MIAWFNHEEPSVTVRDLRALPHPSQAEQPNCPEPTRNANLPPPPPQAPPQPSNQPLPPRQMRRIPRRTPKHRHPNPSCPDSAPQASYPGKPAPKPYRLPSRDRRTEALVSTDVRTGDGVEVAPWRFAVAASRSLEEK
ncbi:hypothetical protein HO173_003551 [Letharia columbiana]|uniref:Uncharacterized protein n=1 Tax=Letharia columbiana TaxID=112416 RepID=A0A8H6G0I7_9LECA|nr:uncharacterized protein HO173_003551 [Letharia columbiana]KAF6238271.1 hypothetical protein HO173_003551 [Letharia columbiana]